MVFEPLPREVAERVIDRAVPHSRLLLRTMSETGMRWGEATALTVGDIDLAGTPASARIDKSLVRDGSGRLHIGPVKVRAANRVVAIPQALLRGLSDAVRGKDVDDLVFSDSRGNPVDPIRFRQEVWLPAVDAVRREYDLPLTLNVHDLRHVRTAELLAATRC